MNAKQPVLLTVLIDTANLRWYVARVDLQGVPAPLIRSEVNNLDDYVGVPFDEQLNFLRHRLSGVLQRGCDRLWGRQEKPCQIVFLADGPFVDAAPDLTARVAEHFVAWMTRPPVVFFVAEHGFGEGRQLSLKLLAGGLEDRHRESLHAGLPRLLETLSRPEAWELAPSRK
jgi:hypothetical protein